MVQGSHRPQGIADKARALLYPLSFRIFSNCTTISIAFVSGLALISRAFSYSISTSDISPASGVKGGRSEVTHNENSHTDIVILTNDLWIWFLLRSLLLWSSLIGSPSESTPDSSEYF